MLSENTEQQLSAQPFLEECRHGHDDSKTSHVESYVWPEQNSYKNSARYVSKPIIVHSVLFLFYTGLCILILNRTAARQSKVPELIPLPARSALQWEVRPFETKLGGNPFTGDPRPELDHAWHLLLQNDNVRVSFEELKLLNQSSIELADGTGAIASLSVFHSLHCLKKIRRWMYKDYYYPNADADTAFKENLHADHCVEYIRESLMCKGDLSLVTFHWINGTEGHGPLLPTSRDRSPHECVNWDLLDSWAGDRLFDLYRLDLLRKPQHDLESD